LKTAVFIPIRTKSTRLPGKALLEINGKPILEYLIERIKTAGTPDVVVICTTTNSEDRVLIPIARRNNIECFQGSEKDILERYLQAATRFNVDFIVNVDGDDIFCDAEYMDKVAQVFIKTNADFIKCTGLPFGAAPTGIKVEALKQVCELKKEKDTETGWGAYFTEGGRFHIESIKADEDANHPEVRMTLDYSEDFQFFEAVIKKLYVPGKVFSLREILSLLKNHPEITELNKKRQEEYWENFNKKAVKITWR
jgi:spore coat polysaccharide biosynthesis protein SpsF